MKKTLAVLFSVIALLCIAVAYSLGFDPLQDVQSSGVGAAVILVTAAALSGALEIIFEAERIHKVNRSGLVRQYHGGAGR